MPSKRRGLLQAFKEMPNDSSTKTLLVALGVAFVCALMISTAAVLLRPAQLENQEQERQEEIQEIVSRLPGIEDLMGSLAEPRVESQVVELATGRVVPSLNASNFDLFEDAGDPSQSIALPAEVDIAGIQRRANLAPIHLLEQGGQVRLYILPVYGSGYASILHGYLALAGDGNTVVALTFYEHGETPGIGGRIDSPEWRNQWQGKKVRDQEGRLRIDVASGRVNASSPEASYQVDGITGATRTSRGVANLLRFWLGDYGYGPFLEQVRSSNQENGGEAQ